MDRKIKIAFIGDGVEFTGFGRVLHSIAKCLYKEHNYEISWLGINTDGDPHEYPYRIYPTKTGKSVYGYDRTPLFLSREQPDIIFLLNDVWIVTQYLTEIKNFYKGKDRPPIVVYFPVDAENHDISWYGNFDIVDVAVTYTEFAKRVATEAAPGIDFKVIPHGIDNNDFFKIDLPTLEIKRQVFPNLDELVNSFIFLNANRNQGRKRLDITMQAFTMFAQNKPENVKLYMHSGVTDMHINTLVLAERYGISKRLIVSSKDHGVQHASISSLNVIYNATDVGINSCYLPKTKVFTKLGYKNIEDVSIGDIVFSHTGKQQKVINTFSYDKEKETVREIHPYGMLPFTLTKNHELFSILSPYLKLERKYKKELIEDVSPSFIPNKYLMEGSILTFPIIQDVKTSVGIEKAFLYGAYIAEGSLNDGIVFSLDSRQYDDQLRNMIIEYMKKVYNLNPHIYNMDRNRQNLQFFSVEVMKEFEKMCGKDSHNKKIYSDLLFMKREEKLSFLKAAVLGDGNIDKRTITYTTVSEELAWQIWFMFTTLGNVAPGLSKRTRGEYCIRLYGEFSKNFDIETNLGKKKLLETTVQQRPKFFIKNNYIYYPIRKIREIEFTGKVYDLEIENEHSYLTHVAGHNSIGEGWGLTSVEHAVTGAPQIVPDHSACKELFSDCGLLVPATQPFVIDNICTTGYLIKPEDLAISMEKIYRDQELYHKLSLAGYKKFTSKEYQWSTVVNQWNEIFMEQLNKK